MEPLAQTPEAGREEIRASKSHVAPSEALPRDDAGLCGYAARNDAVAPRTFHAGDHARDLFARDPGRAASRGGKRREACIWTQMECAGINRREVADAKVVQVRPSKPTWPRVMPAESQGYA